MESAHSERSDLHKYARYHRLCWPSRTTYVDIAHDIPTFFNSDELSTGDEQLPAKRSAEELLTEKLLIDSETGHYLASILKPAERRSASELVDEDAFRCAKTFKLETPALRTDSELNLCQFVNRSNLSKLIDTRQFTLSTFAEAAGDDNVGLDWPAWCHKLPEQLENTCKSEKLQIDRESLSWLQSIISQQNPFMADGHVSIDEFHPQKAVRSRILTPPLSPMTRASDRQNECLSSPLAAPLMPEQGSPSAEISAKLDQTIFMEDNLSITAGPCKSGHNEQPVSLQELKEIFPQITSEGSDIPYLSPTRILASKLKLDETLLPVEPKPKAKCLISEDLMEIGSIPDFQETINSLIGNSDDIGNVLMDCIGEKAAKVDKTVTAEKLQAADTTMRLKVPELDFSFPSPPWKQRGQMKALQMDQQTMISWLKTPSLYESNLYPLEKHLQWVPFPMSVSATVLQENLSDEHAVQDYIKLEDLPDANFDIDNLIWKLPGLRVLDEDLEEEDFELVEGDKEPPPQGSLKKRKAEPEEPLRLGDNANKEDLGVKEAAARAKALLAHGGTRSKPGQPSLFPPNFSATDNLKRFIWSKTGQQKRRRIEELKAPAPVKSRFAPAASNLETPQTSQETRSAKQNPAFNSMEEASCETISLPGTLWDSSSAESTSTHHPKEIAVLSSIISQYRVVFREILTRYPTLELVATNEESDSDLLITQKQADITLGPGRGIILTTLQKIKQRPLPGQKYKDLSPIRARILSLCKYYDSISVIVSHSFLSTEKGVTESCFALDQDWQSARTSNDTSDDVGVVSDDDVEAISLLKAFAVASAKQCAVEVSLVPSTPNAMAECTIRLMTTQNARTGRHPV